MSPAQSVRVGRWLGLTAIHINRVLRQLRDRRLLTVRRGTVTIDDLAGLRKIAGFEGGYLNAREYIQLRPLTKLSTH